MAVDEPDFLAYYRDSFGTSKAGLLCPHADARTPMSAGSMSLLVEESWQACTTD